jgi:hypothetical protein
VFQSYASVLDGLRREIDVASRKEDERRGPGGIPPLEDIDPGKVCGAVLPLSERARMQICDSMEVNELSGPRTRPNVNLSKPDPSRRQMMSKRRIIVKRRTRWTVDEWERGWDLAMSRIDGVPTVVQIEPIFQDCLTVLDGAFADGNGLGFELGLSALIDFCTETVNRGDYEQWWSSTQ